MHVWRSTGRSLTLASQSSLDRSTIIVIFSSREAAAAAMPRISAIHPHIRVAWGRGIGQRDLPQDMYAPVNGVSAVPWTMINPGRGIEHDSPILCLNTF